MYLTIGKGLDKRLDRLEEQLAKLKSRERETRQAIHDAHGEIVRLDRALAEGVEQDALALVAGATPGDDRARLHAEYAAARERPEQLERQLIGLQRAVATKEDELARFVGEHVGELLGEHTAAVHDVVAEVRDEMANLVDALGRLTTLKHRSERLLAPLDGIDGRDVPDDGLDPLRRALDEAHVTAPLPRSLTSAGRVNADV